MNSNSGASSQDMEQYIVVDGQLTLKKGQRFSVVQATSEHNGKKEMWLKSEGLFQKDWVKIVATDSGNASTKPYPQPFSFGTNPYGTAATNIMNQQSVPTGPLPPLIALGNPGVGKSTFLNGFAGWPGFKSGVSFGAGMTSEIKRTMGKDGNDYIDLPGLADTKHGPEAAKAMDEVFRGGEELRILFFVREYEGRISMEDVVVMNLVLCSHPEIADNYGIIVNQIKDETFRNLANDSNLKNFLAPIFYSMKDENITSRILLVPSIATLARKKDAVLEPERIHPCLRDFVDKLPSVMPVPRTTKVTSKLIEQQVSSENKKLLDIQRSKNAEREEEKRWNHALNRVGAVPFENVQKTYNVYVNMSKQHIQ